MPAVYGLMQCAHNVGGARSTYPYFIRGTAVLYHQNRNPLFYDTGIPGTTVVVLRIVVARIVPCTFTCR